MRPFKIFLFCVIIVLLAGLFQQQDHLLEWFETEETELLLDTLELIAEIDSLKIDTSLNLQNSPYEDTLSSLGFLENTAFLDSFFTSLNKSSDTLIRVLYYGDSQIEGDRISFNLRRALQKRFGGTGIGFMPAETYFNTSEGIIVVSNDFHRQQLTSADVVTNQPMGVFCRYFQPKQSVSSLRIKKREPATLGNYTNLKLICSGKCEVSYSEENKKNSFVELSDTSAIQLVLLPFEHTPQNLTLNFSCNNFKLLGLLLDGGNGVAVDHLPFRGGLNLMLNKHDSLAFIQSAKLLNAKLVVLQFGVNLVVDERDSYAAYQIALERDIRLLKAWIPGVSVLVVGASDMAKKHNAEMETYSNIASILKVQRAAAKNEGAAFWDMQKAMGGPGTMIQWVEKGWARPDYAHLTLEGTNYVGDALAADILNAYDLYIKKEAE